MIDETIYYRCKVCNYMKPRKLFFEANSKRGIRCECKECYKLKRLKERFSTECLGCGLPKRVATNGCCKPCNATRGLKECGRCKTVYNIFLAFYDTRTICKWCMSTNKGLKVGRKLKLKTPEIAQAVELRKSGRSYQFIANELHVSLQTVIRTFKRLLHVPSPENAPD